MKLYLHPGFPKCGSSSIQQCLYRNWRSLLEMGYGLPDQAFENPFSGYYNEVKPGPSNRVFHLIANGDSPDAFLRRLDNWVAAGEREGLRALVVTAENLVNEGAGYYAVLDAFRECFDEVEVVAYLRKQDDFYLSAWQQWSYHQGQSFEAFVDERLPSLYPRYHEVCSKLEARFGKGSLRVAPLCREGLSGGDLVADFLRFIGAGLEVRSEDYSSVNSSLNPYLCEALSRVGRLVDQPFSNRLKLLLTRHSSDHSRLLAKRPEFASYQLRKRILKAFEPTNRELHAKYFQHLDFEAAFGVDESLRTTEAEGEKLRLARLEEVTLLQAEVIRNVLAELERKQ